MVSTSELHSLINSIRNSPAAFSVIADIFLCLSTKRSIQFSIFSLGTQKIHQGNFFVYRHHPSLQNNLQSFLYNQIFPYWFMYDKSLHSKSILGYHFIPFKIMISMLTLKILFKPGFVIGSVMDKFLIEKFNIIQYIIVIKFFNYCISFLFYNSNIISLSNHL